MSPPNILNVQKPSPDALLRISLGVEARSLFQDMRGQAIQRTHQSPGALTGSGRPRGDDGRGGGGTLALPRTSEAAPPQPGPTLLRLGLPRREERRLDLDNTFVGLVRWLQLCPLLLLPLVLLFTAVLVSAFVFESKTVRVSTLPVYHFSFLKNSTITRFKRTHSALPRPTDSPAPHAASPPNLRIRQPRGPPQRPKKTRIGR